MRLTLEQADQKFNESVNHFKNELSTIRAGRANTKLVEDILVEVYGQKMPIKQIANITVLDPTLLFIQPWDKSNVHGIKKSIELQGLGINPIVDGDGIKLPVPAMTEERRLEYVKLMKTKLEEGRIAIRQIRKDVLIGLEEMKKEKSLPEDEFDAKEKLLQSKVDNFNKLIEDLAKEKEEELLTV